MEINLNVTLKLSEALETIACALLSTGRRPDAPVAPAPAAPAPQPQPEPAPAPEPQPETPKPEAPAPTPAQEPMPEPEPQKAPGTVTDDEIKAAMDIVFARICGTDDWKDSKDPQTAGRRKALTKIFKGIAADLGGAKPTALEQSQRTEFLRRLDGISLNGTSGLPEYLPF